MATTSLKPRHAAPARKRDSSFYRRLRAMASRGAVLTDAVAITAVTVSIALLHAALPEPIAGWRYLLQHLFYLPIVYAGLRHGWRAGLGTAVLAAVCLLSPVAAVPGRSPEHSPALYWELPIFCAAGILSGLLAERERKQKRASQETAQRLSKVYGELQEKFERMQRDDRLYALGQLAAGLAHEIRNPLASISGAVGIVRRGQSSAQKTAECLEIIQKECQRLSRLLTSFLDFARPRSPNFLNIGMEPLFDSVLGLAEHAVNGAAISLRREIPPGLTFDCDPEQLKQVLLNLVINAIQAMPDGGEVVIAARSEGEKVIIEVRDRGCGVTQEQMEHLYDPFFTTKENGTGLGLPVAHQIVAHLGGVLSARDNPDRGMTFSVELPLHRTVQ
jgi:two-component system, NtrC family, sensor histidine kinase HydH